MMRSLLGRLFAGLAVLILATGLVAGAITFHWAYAEALESQDAILLQVGALAAASRFQTVEPLSHGIDAENLVVVEELQPPHEDKMVQGQLPLPPDASDGLQTIGQGAGQWRVVVRSRADGSRVAVGQLTAYRDEIARGSALRTVLPFAALVPCLMLLVAAVIAYSLRPVARLAHELDASSYDHLAELPLMGMPDELRPFIQSINRLLRRIALMIEQRRCFVADAAHELRSPITALSVQAENLDHAKLPPESRLRLAALQSGIRRTGHLLEQLLALARYDSPAASTAQIVALDQVACDVVADLLPAARARAIDLGFERIEKLSVHGDATALAVSIRNLVGNALRYTPDGGRVDLHLYMEGTNAVLRVEDTGPGICEEDLPHVFEPFYRGRRSEGEGTGLGLSIVDRIVKGVAGSVAVENIPAPAGPGLRVTVTVPLAAVPANTFRQMGETASV
jgi:two-component system OmpR family sensor kinase